MVYLKYTKLIVWHDVKKGAFYYKKYTGWNDYKVGYMNQYDHEVVLVINLSDLLYKVPRRNRLIKRVIRFLEKLEK